MRNASDIDANGDRQTEGLAASDAGHYIARLATIEKMEPQRRGYAFEAFLYDLFEISGLEPRHGFRNRGEQIDGSFGLDGETYLMEAKYTAKPVSIGDLHGFSGKVGAKAIWARGLFVSYHGFSADGLAALGPGGRIVCMDGNDLILALGRRISIARVLRLKLRHAAETGRPFAALADLD